MSLPPISANLNVDTSDSCNWKCCFKKAKEEEQPPPKEESPQSITTTKHVVVETTEVKTYHKKEKHGSR